MSDAAQVTLYDRMCWPDGELERALAGGAHRRELIAYFGPGEYRTLAALAQATPRGGRAAGRAGRGPRVYLLPGLLGTQLGRLRGPDEPPDLVWLDPLDVAHGRLAALHWAAGRHAARRGPRALRGDAGAGTRAARGGPITTLGALPYSYLALKLRLAAAGLDVVVHAYDWRCDLMLLARALARRLREDPANELVLIGHSMGGLLARAALRQCDADTARRVTRLIGVGAPHGGAIGAVQALRATYPVVLRLAALDGAHDAETLTHTVFGGFQSLYQLLPRDTGELDLFDAAQWPRRDRRPDAARLAAARAFAASLAGADARFVSIVGTGQRTATGIARQGEQFSYEISAAGDGTVAVACATLPGARDYSIRCEHSELSRSARVAEALVELSRHGHTGRLREGIHARPGSRVRVTDAMLRRAFAAKVDWQRLSVAARRRYLNRLNAAPALYRATPRR